MYYCYIIKSQNIDKYYIGYCQNVDKRLEYHNNGWSKYTKPGIPWKLCYFEKFDSKTEAIKKEKFLKAKKSKKYLENLIANFIAG